MSIQIINVDQGTPEWFAARCGIPTASNFSKILARGEGKTRMSYMKKLGGEIITGKPEEFAYKSVHMERGNEMEPQARALYAFNHDVTPEIVGFVRNGAMGCSPDSFIGTDGGLEIKTTLPALMIDLILADKFPPEYKAQTQGFLLVCEREWVDLNVFWPGFDPFEKRAYREEAYIRTLKQEIDIFNDELQDLVAQVRAKGHGGGMRIAA